jgi:hypothetical protein
MPQLPTKDQLADRLIEVLKNLPGRPPSEEEFEREVDQKCLELWELDRKQEQSREPSLTVIPRLFSKRDFTPNSIAEQTRREARIRLLKRQEMLLLEQSDLDLCHDLLLQNSTGALSQERINYDGFCQVRNPLRRPVQTALALVLASANVPSRSDDEMTKLISFVLQVGSQLGEKFEHYFNPTTFLHFLRDSEGQISILPLYQVLKCHDLLAYAGICRVFFSFERRERFAVYHVSGRIATKANHARLV